MHRLRASATLALIGSLALLLAPVHPLAAQSFEEETWVVEIQVPVNVVDRNGEPVRGLTRKDFEVSDRGHKREIVDFQVIDLEVLQPRPGEALEEVVPAVARRHFLLLFDLSFSTPNSILRARQAARDFVVDKLHPTDLAAVMTFSLQHGLRLVVTFTPDRAQLARAIDTLGAPGLLERRAGLGDPLRFMIDVPVEAGSGSAATSGGTLGSDELPDLAQGSPQEALVAHLNVIAHEMEKQEKSFARGRIAAWTESLESLADALAEVEGRKHVVYFSEGFDGRLVLGRGPDASDPEQEADRLNLTFGRSWLVDTDDLFGNTVMQNDVARMLREFRKADCVIQAVDISGLRADLRSEDRGRQVGQEVLFYMARETGGAFVENSSQFDRELDAILGSSTHTYLLTFRASDIERDGSYHRIGVKVDAPRGTRLSSRDGYFAPVPFEQLHPLEKSLLAADAIAAGTPRREIGLNVLAAPFRSGPGAAYVPVIVEIDGPSLLVGHETKELPLEIYAYVTDAEGQMRDFFTQRLTLDVERGRQPLRRGGVKFYGHLDLAPGGHLVRVLARNGSTGRTGVAAAPVRVPHFEGEEPLLVGPFFFDSPGHWLLVREQGAAEGGSVVYPFTVNGEVYIPSVHPEVVPGEPARLVLVGYNLASGELTVDPRVTSEDGEILDAGELTLEERTVTGISGYDKILATFVPDRLAAGNYRLQVTLREQGRRQAATTSVPFTVPN